MLGQTKTASLLFTALACAVLSGCGSEDTVETLGDAGQVTDLGRISIDTGIADAEGARDASSSDASSSDASSADAGPSGPDAAPRDGGPVDSGTVPTPRLAPGAFVELAEGRVSIGGTFAEVVATLGPGTRSAAQNSRSYEWTFSGVELTVWFANSNLDADDAPPQDVDGTDRVLWVAVQGPFSGVTPEGIGIGSSRAQVEAAGVYGAPGHTVSIPSPAGTLAQYFSRGILIAYDTGGLVRTVTICRAYPRAPDGTIDPLLSRLTFSGSSLQAYTFVGNFPVPHSDLGDVRALLGEPDAEGNATISGQSLHLLSYTFIGMEFFSLSGANELLFWTLHAPYYGTTSSGVGIGTTRADFEAYLQGAGYAQGTPSSTSASFLCYNHSQTSPDVGVTYSSDPQPVVTSIVVPLHRCP